jgi:hypothetical protein
LGEVPTLFQQRQESAVVVHVSGDARPHEKKLDLAEQFARPALDRLDAAQDQTQLAETTALEVR